MVKKTTTYLQRAISYTISHILYLINRFLTLYHLSACDALIPILNAVQLKSLPPRQDLVLDALMRHYGIGV